MALTSLALNGAKRFRKLEGCTDSSRWCTRPSGQPKSFTAHHGILAKHSTLSNDISDSGVIGVHAAADFGVSYALPIIVADLTIPSSGLMIVENPGPTSILFSPVGRFLKAQLAGDGVQVL